MSDGIKTAERRSREVRQLKKTMAEQETSLARLRREAAGRASEADLYRALSDHAGAGICALDASGRILNANPAFCSLVGCRPGEPVGKRLSDLVAGESDAAAVETAVRGGRERAVFRLEMRGGGGVPAVPCELLFVPVSGGTAAGVATVTELTAYMQAMRTLGEKERFAVQLVKNSTVPGFVIDADHRVMVWNRAMEEATGLKAADVEGTDTHWRSVYDHKRPMLADFIADGKEIEVLSRFYEHIEPLRLLPEGYHGEGWFTSFAGERHYFVFDAVPVRDGQGRVVAVLETIVDETLRRRAEESLVRQKERLETLAGVSRDINRKLSVPAVMRELVVSALELCDAESGAWGLVDDGRMVFREYNDKGRVVPVQYSFPSGKGVPGRVLETRRPHMTNDAEHDPYVIPEIRETLGFRSLVDVPVIARTGEVVGCLEIHNRRGGEPFSREDLSLLRSLAASAAVAIENARIVGRLHRAEAELRRSEALYRTIFENTGAATAIVEADMSVSMVNGELLALLGYSRDELHSPGAVRRVIPDDEWGRLVGYHEARRRSPGAAPSRYETVFVTRGGERRNVLVTVALIPGTARSILSFLDITARKVTEEALRENEQRLRLVIEHSPDQFFQQDRGLRYVWVPDKDALRRECLGRTDRDLFPPDEAERLTALKHRVIETGRGEKAEIRLTTRTRGSRVFESVYEPWYGADGGVIGLLGYAKDVTERILREQALRESEERLRVIAENSPDQLFQQDRGLRYVWAPRVSIPYIPAFMGRTDEELFPPDEAAVMTALKRRVMAEGRGLKSEVSLTFPQGRRFFAVTYEPWRDRDGAVAGVLGYVRDVTGQKEAQEALRESEQRYRTIFENTGSATLIVNEDTTIAMANAESEGFFGYSKAELEDGRSFLDFVVPRMRETHLRYHRMRRAGPGPVPERYESQFLDRGGRVKDVIVSVKMLPGMRRSVVTFLDITARKRAEEELRDARRTAETRAREAEEGKRILDALMDQIPEGILVSEAPDMTIRRISAYARELFGLTRDSLDRVLGGDMSLEKGTLLEADGKTPYRPGALPMVRAMKRGETVISEEAVFRREDGSVVELLANAGPIRDAGGAVVGAVVTWRDITALKEAARRLRESYGRLEQTIDGIITAIAKIVEIRDPYTAGHQKHVSELAYAIAREMGLPENRANGIRVAGGMHDIGKMYVPAEILSKPGRLTSLEIDLIRIHPRAGYDVLRVIEFPWPVAEVAYQHQERLNGSGYPRGLAGEDILLESRIVSVADVVEAMTFHRPYRPEIGLEKALKELEAHRGALYEPAAVDACLRLFREKGWMFSREHPMKMYETPVVP